MDNQKKLQNSKPSLWYGDYYGWPITLPRFDVDDMGPKVIDVGLVDASGNPIKRVEPREPIGFVWPKRDK